MTVMIIQGKVENVFDNEDFARMLREKLGSDAEQYFREQTDPEVVLEDYDTGESHYLNLLDEIEEELKEIMRECEDGELIRKIITLRDKVREELT